MNATPFLRILWKEYRSQLAFWTSVLAAIAVIDLALAAYPWQTKDDRIQALFEVAFVLAMFYPLGSAATLFATERENGTYDFLRALPVGPWSVFFGKAVFTLLSTITLFGFAWIIARIVAGQLPEKAAYPTMWGASGAIAAEFWVWGILFSLLFKRTIVAAVLGGTVGWLVLGLISLFGGSLEHLLHPLANIGVVATSLVLAKRWLQEKRFPRKAGDLAASRIGRHIFWQRVGRLRRLVWQEMRQSTALTITILIMMLPLVVIVWVQWASNVDLDHDIRSNAVYPIFIMLMLIGGLAPVLLGSTMFLGDQTGYHFRFLAERGFPPRLVWLSRHVRGLAVLFVGLLFFLPPANSLVTSLRPSWNAGVLETTTIHMLQISVWSVPVAYACGQLCSMTLRSGILAAAFGGILTALVCGWAALVYTFGMSWSWTVAPLLLAFMAATWLHALELA